MTAGTVTRRATDDTARSARRRRLNTAGREMALLLAAALLYSLVRGVANDRVEAAFRHAEQVISFERSIGIFVETDLQGLILGHDWAVDAANAFYIYGYWPVFVFSLVWLITRRPAAYPLYRNAILASGALSLVIFAFYPLAPPRFLPEHGFVDTITLEATAYRDLNSPTFVNEYAAMPSLHFGWILLLGIAWIALARHAVVRALGVLMPLLMFASIVLTGNHYVLDAVAGGGVIAFGLTTSVLIERWKRGRAVDAAIAGARTDVSRRPRPPAAGIPAQRRGADDQLPVD
ncbi:PAP2 superfamily protein [Haloactinopolyspora alba]|uniref:PAP2 superfamily protein n=1 Tax=Haloactinopolyspora alba TaxID=648780 RepID=A0A2P8E761_9ACTN|nr:phosphatase PAP2 family protein [Haloactinopolyspora alba]PSL05310.1 PAP2 superfamily protein [Haloactinopolyspora alba]